jgi:hypothetical protein
MAKALVVVSDARFSLLRDTCAELAEGLTALGVQAELACFPDPADGQTAFEAGYGRVLARIQAMMDAGDDFFLVDLNCKLSYAALSRSRPLRRFSYVTDAPWSQFEHIHAVGDDTTISYVDRNHAEFHNRFASGRPTVFLPHGGPPPDAEWHDDRPIDVLFIGNLAPPCRMEQFEAALAPLPGPVARAARLALDVVLWEGGEPYKALLLALSAEGLTPEALGMKPFLDLLRFLAAFAESHNRHRLLTGLGRVRITVAGRVSPGFFETVPDNLHLLGMVDEQAALALMRRSRLLLNSVTVFPAGSHERIWYGMACGAAICTDRSSFIEETLTYGTHLLDLAEAMAGGGETLADILAGPPGVLEMARTARPVYAAHHTWRRRAGIIQRAMNPSGP